MSVFAIFRPRRFIRLLVADSLNISRDPILLFVAMMSFLPATLLYFFGAPLDEAGVAHLGIEGLSRYITGPTVIMPAFLLGWVTGFLLLEDRDDGPLLAMETTPTGKSGFLLYRLSVTCVVCFAVALIGARLLVADRGWGAALFLAALVALEAIIVAFILLALARNKVEGLALSKLINIGSVVPLLALLPSGLRYMGGLFPSYWIGEFLGISAPPTMNPWGAAVMAIVVHLVWLLALVVLAKRRMG